jgi:hypothetical protein
MFDHKGTYMRGIALQQKDARVVVATVADFEEDITGKPGSICPLVQHGASINVE